MHVAHGRPEALVPQKRLDIPDVCSGLQKVCGKTVAKQVDAAFFVNTRFLLRLPEHCLGIVQVVGFTNFRFRKVDLVLSDLTIRNVPN